MFLRVLNVWCLIGVVATYAADFPEPVLPAGVGINIHFTKGREKDLDMIAAAGFKFIRMDFSWGGTERKKGEYNWSDYDELTANLEKRGLRAIYILDYSNGLYEEQIIIKDNHTKKDRKDTASPQRPESVAAFARWAGAAATHFKGKRVIWEIWNEPNISFWKPKPDVKQYITLAKATCTAVRRADAQATIIAPGSSGFPWSFLEEMFKAGLLEQLDAVSVHPYRNYSKGPETAQEDYRKLRGMIERHLPVSRKFVPVLSGEWGYATHKEGIPLDTQAAFIVRQQLANLYHGVPLSIWYDWKNDGLDPAYNEHNFGTVQNNLELKPAYVAIQTMTAQLGGYRIARRLDLGKKEDYALLLENSAGAQKIAAWTTEMAHGGTINTGLENENEVAVVSWNGQPLPGKFQKGHIEVTLVPQPQFITLKKRSHLLSAAATWSIRENAPTLVEAGKIGALTVPLRLKNNGDSALSVTAYLEGQEIGSLKSSPQEVVRGTTTDTTVIGTVIRRDQELITNSVVVEVTGKGLANTIWREEWVVAISNPLQLVLTPVEKGTQLRIQNPSGTAFAGMAKMGNTKREIKLGSSQLETTLVLPANEMREQPIQLLDATGQIISDLAAIKFNLIPLNNCVVKLDGDAKVPAQAKAVTTDNLPGTNRPFSRGFVMDYQFSEGWRFARVVADNGKPLAFEGAPAALGIWVYGDGSGNALRMRVHDEKGQTFQPDGPNMDWTGWHWVTFDLKDFKHAGHWGGPNDGLARGKLTLDSLLLVDGGRRKTSGKIYFAGPALIY
jgi:hypothetical protein